jgi:hypothetical protein
MPKTAFSLLTDEFAEAAAAGRKARQDSLDAGHPVTFRDFKGRTVQELPDGRRFEIRFVPGAPRHKHVEVLRELFDSEI